ncbi:hypothetical protein D9M70_578790 [compost metagenome]
MLKGNDKKVLVPRDVTVVSLMPGPSITTSIDLTSVVSSGITTTVKPVLVILSTSTWGAVNCAEAIYPLKIKKKDSNNFLMIEFDYVM